MKCQKTICDFDPDFCSEESNLEPRGESLISEGESPAAWAQEYDEFYGEEMELYEHQIDYDDTDEDGTTTFNLVKRGGSTGYPWYLLNAAGERARQTYTSRPHPRPDDYMRHVNAQLQGMARSWWTMRSEDCGTPTLTTSALTNLESPPATAQVEHIMPVSLSSS